MSGENKDNRTADSARGARRFLSMPAREEIAPAVAADRDALLLWLNRNTGNMIFLGAVGIILCCLMAMGAFWSARIERSHAACVSNHPGYVFIEGRNGHFCVQGSARQ